MNRARGESPLILGGKTFTLRPTFDAMCKFEELTGMTTYEAMRKFTEKRVAPVKAIAAAFHVGIEAAWEDKSKPPSLQEIGGMIVREGVLTFNAAYVAYLVDALTSESDLAKQAQEEEEAGKLKASQTTT